MRRLRVCLDNNCFNTDSNTPLKKCLDEIHNLGTKGKIQLFRSDEAIPEVMKGASSVETLPPRGKIRLDKIKETEEVRGPWILGHPYRRMTPRMLGRGIESEVASQLGMPRDDGDVQHLTAAVMNKCDIFLTENKKHFVSYKGKILILKPMEFLARFSEGSLKTELQGLRIDVTEIEL